MRAKNHNHTLLSKILCTLSWAQALWQKGQLWAFPSQPLLLFICIHSKGNQEMKAWLFLTRYFKTLSSLLLRFPPGRPDDHFARSNNSLTYLTWPQACFTQISYSEELG